MLNFKLVAAVSAALVIGAGVSAKEKPDEPKPRKICRNQEMPGRITPRRICRIVPPSDSAAQDNQRKADDSRGSRNERD